MVVAHENADREVGRIADEPQILGVIGGAGLAGEMLAHLLDRHAGAALDHAFHDRGHLIGGEGVDHLFAIVHQLRFAGRIEFRRVAAEALALVVTVDGMAPAVLDAVDQGRLDALAAVGQHGIGGDHAHDRGFAAAERVGQIQPEIVVDAEATRVFGDQGHADVAGEAHGHQVFRMLDAVAQGMRSVVAFLEILRPPDFPIRLGDLDRLVENDRRGRIAAFERRGVDDRLEGRARLALRLGGAVEVGLVVGIAADHGEDAAGIGVHGDDGAGNFGYLAQAELAGVSLHRLDIDHVALGHRLLHALVGPADAVQRQGPGLANPRKLAGFLARRLQADSGAKSLTSSATASRQGATSP